MVDNFHLDANSPQSLDRLLANPPAANGETVVLRIASCARPRVPASPPRPMSFAKYGALGTATVAFALAALGCGVIELKTSSSTRGNTGATHGTNRHVEPRDDKEAKAGAPAADDARVAIRSTDDVWLISRLRGAVDETKLERTQDLMNVIDKVDPELMVHTTDTISLGHYCPHAWTASCLDLGAASLPPNNDTSMVPGYDYAVTWRWIAEDGYARMGWNGQAKSLAKNTPGFILGSHPSVAVKMVFFLSADGGYYVVEKAKLALGAPPARDWPAQVQHTMYDVELLQDTKFPDRPRTVSPALTKDLKAAYQALLACGARAWKPASQEFAANAAANISQRTRENRGDQIELKYRAASAAACKTPLAGYAVVMKKVLDERKAERQSVYEAAKARFAK